MQQRASYRAVVTEKQVLPAEDMAAEKLMRLRYNGQCRLCGVNLPVRTLAIFERSTKTVRCVDCAAPPAHGGRPDGEVEARSAVEAVSKLTFDPGAAGASARREHSRLVTKREDRVRAAHPKLGGLLLALSDEPQSAQAWRRGAIGEEKLGARLNSLITEDLVVLHDRRMPGSVANIDHIVITRSRVWVVDAKRYQGQRPELKVEGGLVRPEVVKLLVGRRDRTKLVDGVRKQVDVVRRIVGEVPVTGAMCFIDADWPLLGAAFTIREVEVVSPRRLGKRLAEDSDGELDVVSIGTLLASRLRTA